MQPRAGIRRKIWVGFVLQLAAISFAIILGVYGAGFILKDVLINRALVSEAGHYWQRVAKDPAAQLPDTYNLRSYLLAPGAAPDNIPMALRRLSLGYHRVVTAGVEDLVHVSDGPPGRLYLVFKQEQVNRLALLFGFVPFMLVLLIIYATTWITYRASRRAMSPVIALANTVRSWDPKKPDLDALLPDHLPANSDGDVETLGRALHGFASRIEEFVERERNFTRDASHELRSPLTVIKIAADVLEEETLSPFGQRSTMRIRTAARDMEALIEAFLLLAREGDTGLPEEDFSAVEVVREEVESAQPLLEDKPVEIRVVEPAELGLHAPPRVFAVLIGNLIRNAIQYTPQGTVTVTIDADEVSVADTGIGMSEEEVRNAFTPFFAEAVRPQLVATALG